jgi:Ser/Thr protein kinase RdoA (MazF antagonist)
VVNRSTGLSATSINDLLRAVEERYGLDGPVIARPLSGGYANDVCLLEGDGAADPVVLHVKYPPVDLDSLAWEHRLLDRMSTHLPEALAPLRALDGSTFFLHDERPVWLVRYVAGGPAGADDRLAVARILGRLHSIDVDLPARPGRARLRDLPIPPIGRYPAAFDAWLPRIETARTELIELVRDIDQTRTLTSGITHNDVFPGNVLVDRGTVTAFLDWEEADVDWLVWDLAAALWPYCSRGDDLDTAAMAEFLGAYRDAGARVPADEDDLLVPLIRTKRMLEVLRAPTDRDPQWNYQLANLGAYERLG